VRSERNVSLQRGHRWPLTIGQLRDGTAPIIRLLCRLDDLKSQTFGPLLSRLDQRILVLCNPGPRRGRCGAQSRGPICITAVATARTRRPASDTAVRRGSSRLQRELRGLQFIVEESMLGGGGADSGGNWGGRM